MDAQEILVAGWCEKSTQIAEQLALVSNQAQQTIEAVKQALLLTDAMGLFGAGLVNRLNAGTADTWERKAPVLDAASAFVETARDSLAAMEETLVMLHTQRECKGEETL